MGFVTAGVTEPITLPICRIYGFFIYYYAVPGNIDRLNIFAQRLRRLWRLILSRRSQRGHAAWDWMTPIFQRWIPAPRVLHPYPFERFVATHPRWELYA